MNYGDEYRVLQTILYQEMLAAERALEDEEWKLHWRIQDRLLDLRREMEDRVQAAQSTLAKRDRRKGAT